MNKVELIGKVYKDVKVFGADTSRRALFVIKCPEEGTEFTSIIPVIAWRELADQAQTLKADQDIHVIARVRRHQNKANQNWETDIEIKQIL